MKFGEEQWGGEWMLGRLREERTCEQVDGGMLEQEGKSRALQPWASTEWSCWRNTLRSVLQN
jgi:hypothetical protein